MLQEASRLGYYIKNKDGGEYDNWCWPGELNFTFLNKNNSQFTEENRVQWNRLKRNEWSHIAKQTFNKVSDNILASLGLTSCSHLLHGS